MGEHPSAIVTYAAGWPLSRIEGTINDDHSDR